MKFRIFGPFEISRKKHRILREKKNLQDFWRRVDETYHGLSAACGCYVFSIRGKAWYVGLTQRRTFKAECFQPHKIMLYNDALDKVTGKVTMIFIAKITDNERFAKPTKNRYPAVEALENMLIGFGVHRNKYLMNIKGTKFLRTMKVPGIINSGKGAARGNAVRSLKKAVGI